MLRRETHHPLASYWICRGQFYLRVGLHCCRTTSPVLWSLLGRSSRHRFLEWPTHLTGIHLATTRSDRIEIQSAVFSRRVCGYWGWEPHPLEICPFHQPLWAALYSAVTSDRRGMTPHTLTDVKLSRGWDWLGQPSFFCQTTVTAGSLMYQFGPPSRAQSNDPCLGCWGRPSYIRPLSRKSTYLDWRRKLAISMLPFAQATCKQLSPYELRMP